MINGLPEKLKELRKQHTFSQRMVAQRLGVSPSIISGYETGERTPSAGSILTLATLYHCSTDYLLGRNSVAQARIIDVNGLSEEQVRLLVGLVNTMRD